jgi:hypothetical protein
VTEREKTLIDALLEDHKEEGPPTEFTATIAPGMCAKIDEPGVMDSGANGTKPFARVDVKRINHVPPQPAIDPLLLPTLNPPHRRSRHGRGNLSQL